jgi:hypothetical protein
VRAPQRSLVLVVGAGRSGTSLFSGILQRLGFHVPEPEVPADETNPRGFAESQWVVDFHDRLLARARVQVSDARPAAWAHAEHAGRRRRARDELGDWLAAQFARADHVLVKDPRLSWFLPLWRRCAEDLGRPPRFVTLLRHPAAVIESRRRAYGGRDEAWRAAGWINQTVSTERATRDAPRVFVRYDDLLADVLGSVARVGEGLDLAPLREASEGALRAVGELVEPALNRSRVGWDDLAIPAPLRAQAEQVWRLLSRLGDDPREAASLGAALDAASAAYRDFYADVEAIAHSSIAAAELEAASWRRVARRSAERWAARAAHALRRGR